MWEPRTDWTDYEKQDHEPVAKNLSRGEERRFNLFWSRDPVNIGYWTLALTAVVLISLSFSLSLTESPAEAVIPEAKRVVIAGKQFAESSVLLELMAVMIEEHHPDFEVNREYGYGVNVECFYGLQFGDVHLYPDYTGTILANNLRLDPEEARKDEYHKDLDELNKLIADNPRSSDVRVVLKFGFENSYVMTSSKETAERIAEASGEAEWDELDLSNLIKYTEQFRGRGEPEGSLELTFIVSPEFQSRPDGLPGLSERGLFLSKSSKTVDHNVKYPRLAELGTIVDGYETDPQLHLSEYNDRYATFKNLVKGKPYFPRYKAVAVANREFMESHPEIITTLERLKDEFSEKDMAELIAEAKSRVRGRIKGAEPGTSALLETPLSRAALEKKFVRDELRAVIVEKLTSLRRIPGKTANP